MNPGSLAAEPMRLLRTSVRADPSIRSVAVAGVRRGVGATMVAVNLALSFAQAGESTLLVDADGVGTTATKAFQAEKQPGLSSLANDDVDVERLILRDVQPGLDLIPAGSSLSTPGGALASTATLDAFREIQGAYGMTIAASPPVLEASDALEVARLADGVLLVVDIRQSRRRDVDEAIALVVRSGARVIGSVINRDPHRRSGSRPPD